MTKQIIYYLTPDLTKEELLAIIGEGLIEQEKGNIPIISVKKTLFKEPKQLELIELILKRAEKNGFGIIIEPSSPYSPKAISIDQP